MNCPCLRPTITSMTWRDQYESDWYQFYHLGLTHCWRSIEGTWRLSMVHIIRVATFVDLGEA